MYIKVILASVPSTDKIHLSLATVKNSELLQSIESNSTAYASGELVFQWHTDPDSVTNVTERFPR